MPERLPVTHPGESGDCMMMYDGRETRRTGPPWITRTGSPSARMTDLDCQGLDPAPLIGAGLGFAASLLRSEIKECEAHRTRVALLVQSDCHNHLRGL